jgi:cysteine desulfurase/selenocysteine lyase
MFDAHQHQADFPILARQIHGDKHLVYLDNAATSQKPAVVIDAISDYYRQHNANVHRGIHQLGDESTKLFHSSRQNIAAFFGAKVEELIITRNATEGINQIACTWGDAHVQAGDVIVATEMEHHSNLVPWQELAARRQARLELVEVLPDGRLNLEHLEKIAKAAGAKLKVFTFVHISNTLGTLNPVDECIAMVKKYAPNAKVLIDGAQAAPHIPVDFAKIDADFYAISAHKMLGPMGIGGVLVKQKTLQNLPPFLFGGGMINEVTLEKTTFAEDLEERFTAGTPDVASLVSWAAAVAYLQNIGMKELQAHDHKLVEYALEQLQKLPQIQIVGPLTRRVGSVAFVYNGVHAHDVGQILDSEGVAVRSGHHCTMPLHTKFGWLATVRISFQLYNSREDVDACVTALQKVARVFAH